MNHAVPGTPPSPAAPQRDLTGVQRALHAAFAVVLVLVAIGTLVVIVGWFLSRRVPSWWATPDLGDPALAARAESVEQFVSNELSRPREGNTPWRIIIPEDAATAWVNVRLPRWLENRDLEWPLADVPILVRFRAGGTIVLAADVSRGHGAPRIIGAHARPGVSEAGPVLQLTDVSVGALTLPPSLAASSVRRAVPDDAGANASVILRALLHGEPLAERSTWRVDESRAVTLLDVSIEDRRALLTCVTTRSD